MKGLSVAALLILALVAATLPVLSVVYGEAYPDDAARQQALAACERDEAGFNRLLAASRTACYERRLTPLPARSAPPNPRPERLISSV